MTIEEASQLIAPAFGAKVKEYWADLGSGTGVFTNALASLLGDGSEIYAIDKVEHHLVSGSHEVTFHNLKGDFIHDNLPLHQLDGIMIANALHYAADPAKVMDKLAKYLKPSGKIIIIEYDTDTPNQWVPFPISFERLVDRFQKNFSTIRKIGQKNSIYRDGILYAAVMSERNL